MVADQLPSIQDVVKRMERNFGADRLREVIEEPRRILPPNGFVNPWNWWVMATSTKLSDRDTDAGYVARGVIEVLKAHESPTYFVGRDVVEAMERTDFGNAPMRDIKWGHDGILFMLPNCEELHYDSVSRVIAEDGSERVIAHRARPIGVAIANTWSVAENAPGVAILTVDNVGAVSWSFMPYRDTWQEAVDYICERDLTSPTPTRLPWQHALVDSERKALLKNCSLVFKILCLWNSERSDGSPEILRTGGTMIRRGNPRRTDKKAHDLWSGLLVNLNGALVHESDGDGAEDGKVRRHWRRGHFRNQPHGVGRALRRSVWIRPYMAGSL